MGLISPLALLCGFTVGLTAMLVMLLYESYMTSGSRDNFWVFIKKWLNRDESDYN